MFEARLTQGVLLRKLLDSMKDLVQVRANISMLCDASNLLMCSTAEQLHKCDGGLKPSTGQT